MARFISNSNLITNSFEVLVHKISELAYAFSTEVITANSTYANTGSVASPLKGQLYGIFGANTIVVTNGLKGGNVNGLTAALPITSAVTVSGDATISGITNLNANVSYNNEYVVSVVSNTNIGSNTTSPQLIYSFPVATYGAAKFNIKISSGAAIQMSDLIVAHSAGNSYITVYGTVAAPPSANNSISPLGIYSSVVNNANVEIRLTQTNPASAVKVVAHLIK